MPKREKKYFCSKHGGDGKIDQDAGWLCDVCSQEGINKCKCGGIARGFGEALMSTVSCEDCDEDVAGMRIDARKLWNEGFRGWVNKDGTPEEF